MEITKEQESRILKSDPNFFKEKLEVGKWYKHNRFDLIVFRTGVIDNAGFHCGTWSESVACFAPENWNLATGKEVEDALTKEMVKRGYAKGNFICLSTNQLADNNLTPCYSINYNALWNENGCVFKNGIWATKLETITKSEAEKLLNKIII